MPVGRSPGPSYSEVLDLDTHPVRAMLYEDRPGWFGDHDIPVSRYTTREFHELEKRHVWRKVWQMACRDEHLPHVGDTWLYRAADLVVRLVRTAPDRIDATAVATDEPVAVDTWGGFVFVNPDPTAAPLREFLGDFIDHFEPWHFETRYVEAHVRKSFRANWKVVQEAFMESFHVGATHPQQLVRLGDTNTRYDCWPTFSRALHPSGIPSPYLTWEPTQQEMLDSMLDVRVDEDPPVVIPEGETLRTFASDVSRQSLRPSIGDEVDTLSDAELLDAMVYTVFPNFHPWAAYQRLVYRFLPNGDDHETSTMEVLVISPYVGERPPPAAVLELGFDDSWLLAPALGITCRILEQDGFNLPLVQRGLHSTAVSGLRMALYQESRIRHVHHLLEQYIGADQVIADGSQP